MRILYLARGYTVHDHRFLATLAKARKEILFLVLEIQSRDLIHRNFFTNTCDIRWKIKERIHLLAKMVKSFLILRRYIIKFRPEIIHAGPVQDVAFTATLTRFRPIVTMSWGSDLLVTAESSSFNRLITTFTLRKSTVLIVDCKTVARRAISLGFPPEKIVVFPWGVDLNHFKPRGASVLRTRLKWLNNLVLISVRSWEPIYGIETLVKSFIRVSKKTDKVRLILLGTGSLSDKINKMIRINGIERFVYKGGFVKQKDLPKYYSAADVYISTSLSDGSSVSLMEALASGCPVLVSDIPGNREWVRSGIEGWFFEAGNVDSLEKQILMILKNEHLLRTVKENARKTAEKRANWKKNSKGIFSAYELALKEGPNG